MEIANLPDDAQECEGLAENKMQEAASLCLGDRGTLDRYKTLVADVQQLTKASGEKQAAITKIQVRFICCSSLLPFPYPAAV